MRRWLPDLLIVAAIFVAGAMAGASYRRAFLAAGAPEDFGHVEFGAAVALACGHGFVDPGSSLTPALDEFLHRQRDSITCADLPASLPPTRPNFTQGLYRYLMSAAGYLWAYQGRISWSGLTPLFGLAYGATLAAAYGLFRLGIGRPLSVVATLALMVSAVHLAQLPNLRDYAKAPFILALIWIMARMAVPPFDRRRIVLHALAFGVVLGIGLGFRNDLLINVPPFLAVVLFCLPGKLSDNAGVKAAAIGVALIAVGATAWPILSAYGRGSNTGHVALLGLMSSFDEPLGIHGSIYGWGHAYSDGFIANIIQSYSSRVHDRSVVYLSQAYERDAVEYLLRIAAVWPADILVRAYASVFKTLEMPFLMGVYANGIPIGLAGGQIAWIYEWQALTLRYLAGGCGAIVCALALAIIGAHSWRAGLALVAFLIYYGGYPAIQFHIRHFFHLEFIAWWAIAFVAERGALAAWRLGRGGWRGAAAILAAPETRRFAVRAARFAAVSTLIIAGSLAALRAYQAPRLRSMFTDYLAAPKTRLAITARVDGDRALLHDDTLWASRPEEAPTTPVSARYIVAEFSSADCAVARLPVVFKYRYPDASNDFSLATGVSLSPDGAPTTMFFPAYYNPNDSYFQGIEVPRGLVDCVKTVSTVTNLAAFPVLLDVTLAPGWRNATLYQTLNATERQAPIGVPAAYTAPRDLAVPLAAVSGPAPESPGPPVLAASIARTDGRSWTIKGRPDQPTADLLRFSARRLHPRMVFVAEGELRRGGFRLSLLNGDEQSSNVSVTTAGRFLAAVAPPAEGDYGVLLSSRIGNWWPAMYIGRRIGPLVEWIPGATIYADFSIDRLGWVEGPDIR